MSIGPDSDVDARRTADAERPLATDDVLRSVVVTYEGSPDRRTVYPVGATESERTTHWLTADDASFVPLDERR